MTALLPNMAFQMEAGEPPYICDACRKPINAGDAAVLYRLEVRLKLHDLCAFRVIAGMARDLAEVAAHEPSTFCFHDGPHRYDAERLGYLKKCYEVLKSQMYVMCPDPEMEEEDDSAPF